jgi:hypothetical protein
VPAKSEGGRSGTLLATWAQESKNDVLSEPLLN